MGNKTLENKRQVPYSNGDLLEGDGTLWVVKEGEPDDPDYEKNPGWCKIGPVFYGPNGAIFIEVVGYTRGDYHQLDATKITRWWKQQETIVK